MFGSSPFERYSGDHTVLDVTIVSLLDPRSAYTTVHTFDLRERNEKNIVFSKALSKYGAIFHHWGIGTSLEAVETKRMKTLQQTIEGLNHSHRTIDILKIDCESCEWYQYQSWLDIMRSENVFIRQILVETHHVHGLETEARNFFMSLHDAGYVIFSKEANFEAQGSCVEYAFIKLSTDFFGNETLYFPRFTRIKPYKLE